MTEPPKMRTPRATYRLQFRDEFTFADAEQIAPYLADLGVSHVYASPYLKARAGSAHGYDIIDHNALNPEIGDEESFRALCDALQRHDMGQILDFVPNHMGIGRADNAWWLDALEWGEESPYAEYFDIDWTPAKVQLQGKVLLPVLGEHYGRILESGQLKAAFNADEGTFSVWYYEHRFPINPDQYTNILGPAIELLRRWKDVPEQVLADFEFLDDGFRDLARQRGTRRAEAERLKQQLAELACANPLVANAIGKALDRINGNPNEPASFGGLHDILQAQPYRLAFWRVAAEEINYRRFFQINDLAGINVQVLPVFEATHRLVLKLIGEGRLHGLRIDHIDGLFDPKQYLQRLQARACEARDQDGGQCNREAVRDPFYIVVEKILAPHEWLRDDWPVAGTTGYDFLNRLNGIFINPAGEAALTRIYERFIGAKPDFEETVYQAKKQVMDLELASELRVLANELNNLSETSWLTRDYTLVGLRQALRELVACFPVYRTYVDSKGATPEDRRDIDWATAHARRRSMRMDKSVFDFIYALLTTDLARDRHARYNRRGIHRLAMKFQQYTGPVMAKGVEDTAFYRYNRLISLNEVGGEPARFGITLSAFHRVNQDCARRWPHAMLSTATHDTKRGEDARARINVLSEIPSEWRRRVRRWATLNQRRKTDVNGVAAPDANDEYLLYQTLVGAWPIELHDVQELEPDALDAFRQRIGAYMIKAVREAKVHSSWINPNADYEDALNTFLNRVLDATRGNPFLSDFQAFHRRVARVGMLNSLAQTALKFTAPGVPDIYQGCDLWDFSLVDPDNRRPVNFGARVELLNRLKQTFRDGNDPEAAFELIRHWPDGMVKMFVVWRLLQLRRFYPELLLDSDYIPVEVVGDRSDRVCGFVREHGDWRMLVVVPRLMARLMDVEDDLLPSRSKWADTAVILSESVSATAWRDVFTNQGFETTAAEADPDQRRMLVADLLAHFPIAVLLNSGETEPCPS